MEGLLPIIFAALWIIFGGIGSKKKREDAARRQRELAQRTAREREAQRAQRLEKRRADSAVRTAAERAREEAREARASVQESSVDMIPDELWNILTGGAPRPPRSQQPSGGGWTTSPPWDEEDAVHSIEGVSTEVEFGDETDYDDEAISHARSRDTELRDTPWDQKPTSRDAIAIAASETSDGRHVEFHDKLRATEIGSAREVAAGPSAAALRLGLRNRSDVRRAIVLAEILGPPKALR